MTDPSNKTADVSERRYYKLETFANAVEKQVHARNGFIPATLQKIASGSVGSIRFRFLHEDKGTLNFSMTVVSPKGKRSQVRLIAAKNAEEHSRALKRRFEALQHVATRAPKQAAKPLASGTVYLPDRHRRTELGREVFCCICDVPSGFDPLVTGADGRLGVQEKGFKALSARDDARARVLLLRLVAQSYDPARQTGLRLPKLSDETLLIQRSTKGGLRLMISLPSGLRSKLSTPKLLNEILCWETPPPAKRRLRPDTIGECVDALTAAVGPEAAKGWLTRYRQSLEQGRYPEIPPLTAEALRESGY